MNYQHCVWRRAALVLVLILGCSAVLLVPAVRADTVPDATPEPTPAIDARPDACEPNNTPKQACMLALNSVSPTLTLLPDGDSDYYSMNLGATPTNATTLIVRGTSGLDLLTTITRAGETVPVTTISSPALSTTLAADLGGWIVLRVENRAPQGRSGESYRIEVRTASSAPAPTSAPSSSQATPTPDMLENNYDIAHAAPIALDTIYDLNFTCPVLHACDGGGDHDYLQLPVKSGVTYLLATFDLGPGVDTVIDLFWGDESHPVTSNDDFASGGLLSMLTYQAPANGMLILRVGPRNGGMLPRLADAKAGTYRLVAALASSKLAADIKQTVRDQSNAPAPTATPDVGASRGHISDTAAAAPQPLASTAAPTENDAPTGSATVIAAGGTQLREGPGVNTPIIITLPQDSVVTLSGQAAGGWVRVQPLGSVVPGWVYGPALRRDASAPVSPPNVAASTAPDAVPTATATGSSFGMPDTPAAAGPVALSVTRLGPSSMPEPMVEPRVPLTAKIAVQDDAIPARPRPGVRAQLVNALGDVLTDVVTDSTGAVTLTRDIPPHTMVFLQIPAAGVLIPFDLTKPDMTLTIPVGGTP